MNISYLIYQAERQKGVAEQREADILAGELAASIAKAGRAVKAAVSRVSGNRPQVPVIPGDDLIPELSSRH
jgi:ribosomal protein L35AE/L33A